MFFGVVLSVSIMWVPGGADVVGIAVFVFSG